MNRAYKEYKVKTKMVQEQCLQLKINSCLVREENKNLVGEFTGGGIIPGWGRDFWLMGSNSPISKLGETLYVILYFKDTLNAFNNFKNKEKSA